MRRRTSPFFGSIVDKSRAMGWPRRPRRSERARRRHAGSAGRNPTRRVSEPPLAALFASVTQRDEEQLRAARRSGSLPAPPIELLLLPDGGAGGRSSGRARSRSDWLAGGGKGERSTRDADRASSAWRARESMVAGQRWPARHRRPDHAGGRRFAGATRMLPVRWESIRQPTTAIGGSTLPNSCDWTRLVAVYVRSRQRSQRAQPPADRQPSPADGPRRPAGVSVQRFGPRTANRP
jgi:hypothetical protein